MVRIFFRVKTGYDALSFDRALSENSARLRRDMKICLHEKYMICITGCFFCSFNPVVYFPSWLVYGVLKNSYERHVIMDLAEQNSFFVCTLGSGSKGNAILIGNGSSLVLLDAGLSAIEISRRMGDHGFHPEQLDALVVSHEHSDHVRSISTLSSRYSIPVYVSRGTMAGAGKKLGKVYKLLKFECGMEFSIRDLTIHPFSVSHDAADTAGFTITRENTRIGIATDLGVATRMVCERLKDCSVLVIEANHDPAMLMSGPYPWHLKQRVKSRTGHLSNEETRDLLGEVISNRLRHVVLAHISEKNNTPEKALQTVGEALSTTRINLVAASQETPGPVLFAV